MCLPLQMCLPSQGLFKDLDVTASALPTYRSVGVACLLWLRHVLVMKYCMQNGQVQQGLLGVLSEKNWDYVGKIPKQFWTNRRT